MENLKRSEKHRLFKEHGAPRYLMLDKKEKRREQLMWTFIASMMLLLAFLGKTETQKTFGMVVLFIVSLLGVFDR